MTAEVVIVTLFTLPTWLLSRNHKLRAVDRVGPPSCKFLVPLGSAPMSGNTLRQTTQIDKKTNLRMSA